MGVSISVPKRKKRILRHTLSKNSSIKLSEKLLSLKSKSNRPDCGFVNRFTDDMMIRNIRYSKYSPPEEDLNHYITQKLWECDFKAPVKNILSAGNARVLDVVTGQGTWVMQCAENYPWSNFTGVDAFPVFPTITNIRLMNVTFLQSNILDKLVFDDNTFDFVHMRCLNLAFTDKEWENQVLKEIIRVCKPGGWIEFVKSDFTYINQGPTFKNLCDSADRFFLDHNEKPISSQNIVYYLQQSGQVTEINEEIKNTPFYGSKLGKAFNNHLIKYIQLYKDVLSGYMGYSYEEWDDTIKTIKKELVEYKTEDTMRRVYCKKIIP